MLSLQLPFAIVPLIRYTSSRAVMGAYANPAGPVVLAVLIAALIVALNAVLAPARRRRRASFTRSAELELELALER